MIPAIHGFLAGGAAAQVPRRLLWPFPVPATEPYALPEFATNEPLVKELLLSCFNSRTEAMTRPVDLVSNRAGTCSASYINDSRGTSPLFASASSRWASVPLDLSAYSVLGFSWWMYWDANASDSKIAWEYTANINTTGVNGLNCNPNNSNGFFTISASTNGSNNVSQIAWVRPPAGVWHHFGLNIDRNQVASSGLFITSASMDGAPFVGTTNTTVGAGASGNNSGPSTMYFFSRGGASNFADGRIAYFNVFRRPLLRTDYARLWRSPRLLLRYPNKGFFR